MSDVLSNFVEIDTARMNGMIPIEMSGQGSAGVCSLCCEEFHLAPVMRLRHTALPSSFAAVSIMGVWQYFLHNVAL